MTTTYTHGHHASVLRSHTWRTAANSAGYLLPRLRAGQRLLDLGCGPGTITLDLAELVAPGEVVGLDREASLFPAARAAAADRGLAGVRFGVGDAQALAEPDASYDVVHAHQLLQHLGDPVGAMREMRRVVRPGGVLAARDADYAAMTWFPADPRLDRWMAVYAAVTRRNGGEPDAGRRLAGWARAAGWSQVTASAGTWCYATPEERAWWAGLWAERVTASALAEQAVAHGVSDRAELHELAAGWHAWATHEDGWFAVLHGEVLGTA